MKKTIKKKLIISSIVIAIIVIIAGLIYSLNFSETMFSPSFGDKSIDALANKYYFPITLKANPSTKCTNSNVQYGANFKFSTNTLPTATSSCIVIFGQAYQAKKTIRNVNGDCSSEGTFIKFQNTNVFSYMFLIDNGTGYKICKDQTKKTKHDVVIYEKTTSCSVKYELAPSAEKEGQYYCDGKNIVEYLCNKGSKITIEKCELGCEYANVQVDSGTTKVAKCKGDFKPNNIICASTGKKLYTINSTGGMKSEDCCSCSNKVCTKCAPDTSTNCKLINGTGSNQINVFVYGDNQAQMEDWGQWIYSMLIKRTPYSEYTFNLYYEKTQGACTTVRHSSKDFDATWATWIPATGYSSFDRVSINHVWFNPARTSNLKWEFLLFHELGHDYARMGHSTDGSIMDLDGGDSQYRDYQIKTIRNTLTVGN